MAAPRVRGRHAALAAAMLLVGTVSAIDVPFSRNPKFADRMVPHYRVGNSEIEHVHEKKGDERLSPSPRLLKGSATSTIRVEVHFKEGSDSDTVVGSLKNRAADSGFPNFFAKMRRRYTGIFDGFSAELSADAVEYLHSSPDVETIDLVRMDRANGPPPPPPPTITEPTNHWHLDYLDGTMDNTYVHPAINGAGGTVIVIDTGSRFTHEQFAGNVVSGKDYVDDDMDSTDCDGHGTHVMGSVGGSSVGVADGVTLVANRVLDCSGSGFTDDSNAAMIDATNHCISGHYSSPCVMSLSLGAPLNPGEIDATRHQIIDNALAAGVVTVVAAGNADDNACNYSPAQVPSAVTVNAAKLTQSGQLLKADFSNHGPCTDIWAPGQDIYSAMHHSDTSYGIKSGTSMATPLVSGAMVSTMVETGLEGQDAIDALMCLSQSGALSGDTGNSPNLVLQVRESMCWGACGCLTVDCSGDFDSDGHDNCVDNCPFVSNPSQSDSDADSIGDACDHHDANCIDVDNDNICDDVDPCVSTETTVGAGQSTTIYDSGGASQNYGNNEGCPRTLETATGYQLRFTFTWDIEELSDMFLLMDGTEIITGHTPVHLTGVGSGFEYVTMDNTAQYVLVTDESVTRAGFSALVESVPATLCASDVDQDGLCDEYDDCVSGVHQIAAGQSINIASQVAPKVGYNNYMDCWQTFVAPEGSILIADFDFIITEENYDYLSVIDGHAANGTLLEQIDGNEYSNGVKFESTGNQLALAFDTDEWLTEAGYAGTITAAPATPTCPNGEEALSDVQWLGPPFNLYASPRCIAARGHDCQNPDFDFEGKKMWSLGGPNDPMNSNIETCGQPE